MLRTQSIEVTTHDGRRLYDITREVQGVVSSSGVEAGLCNVFIHHTSASLLINENADPQVLVDLEAFFARLVPDGDRIFRHVDEGPDDMPSHVRSALTQTSLTIPVVEGRCALGTWQAIYVYEHRLRAHRRRVTISVLGG